LPRSQRPEQAKSARERLRGTFSSKGIPVPSTSLSYAEYLQLDKLLALQRTLSDPPEHDELLFIVVHQVYELWFRQLLHEIDALCISLAEGDHPHSFSALKRVRTILKTMVGQIDVLETMGPTGFQSFRERLQSASGLESTQFREVEFLCGHKRASFIERTKDDEARQRLRRRFDAPTLYDAFIAYLSARCYAVPPALLVRDVTREVEPSEELQTLLARIYREDTGTTQICELLVDFDEGFQEWRYRHVKMVERTIGSQSGTGGSTGVQYLRGSLFRPFFPDLWQVRDRL
jgi:tryptophan 2,3-dioxygenase